jgi:soluble lytic murein transglycosylase-like protein
MTKLWLSVADRIPAVPNLALPGHHRVTAGILAGVLAVVLLVSGATAPLDARPTVVAAHAPVAIADLRSAVASANHRAAPADAGMEAVANAIARKYRVSDEATRDFVRLAYLEGSRHGVDPLLIVSVMAIESRFNPVAQSEGGAMGLMQVIPRFHAEKFDATNQDAVLDPRTNIQVGVKILKEYIRRGGNEPAGLQLYNGAPDDPALAYASRVLGEKRWLQDAVQRARNRTRA